MASDLRFIVGGVQKAGTTALFEYLAKHPELAVPDQKELHFFDNETIDWSAPDYRILHGSFRDEGVRFEVTPIYLYWPDAISRILSYRPGMLLVFLFRDPIERAFSGWCMEFGRGNETLSFQEAIRGGRSRLLSAGPKSLAYRHWTYVERGFYGQQTVDLLSVCPRQQTLFLRSDDLERDPQRTLDLIADFVGIDRFPAMTPVRVHERQKLAYPSTLEQADIAFLQELYRADIELFAEVSGVDVTCWLTMRGAEPADAVHPSLSGCTSNL